MQQYVRNCVMVDESLGIVKYCLSVMLKPFSKPESRNKIAFLSASASSLKELR